MPNQFIVMAILQWFVDIGAPQIFKLFCKCRFLKEKVLLLWSHPERRPMSLFA